MRRSHVAFVVGLMAVLTVALVAQGNQSHRSKHKPGYRQVNLVSDLSGMAPVTDTNLVNPWGITITPNGRIWVSDNGRGVSTIYLTDGTPLSLVVTVPPAPTGVAFNSGGGFNVTEGTNSGPSRFIFVTEGGVIAGWNPTVNPTVAITAVDNSLSGAIYKAVTLARDASSNAFLYAANFHGGVVEKYDANFALVTSFTDTNLPAGFAPFNVADIGGRLFVTFAMADEDGEDDVPGPGLGYVDVFDLDGNLVQSFAAQGTLNAPWGLALAPGHFGRFSGALLVGNFGDGRINAFDAESGKFRGQLADRHGDPIEIEGLWGLLFPDRAPSVARPDDMDDDDHDEMDDKDETEMHSPALFFTAGINDEADGLFGFIQPAKSKELDRGKH